MLEKKCIIVPTRGVEAFEVSALLVFCRTSITSAFYTIFEVAGTFVDDQVGVLGWPMTTSTRQLLQDASGDLPDMDKLEGNYGR